MKRSIGYCTLGLALAALLLMGCGILPPLPGGAQQQQPGAPTLPPVRGTSNVVAEGRLLPLAEVTLTLPTGGTVAQLLVAEGDLVQRDAPLLRLDAAAQQAALAQAEAGLAAASAHLNKLEEGARPADLAVAQAGVQVAQASLAVAQSQAASAQAAVAGAEAQVAQAQAALADLRAGATDQDVQVAQLAVERAENAHWGAQAVRDGVAGAVDRGQAQGYDLDQAEANVGVAWVAWQMAQAELARLTAGSRVGLLAQAQAAVAAAQAHQQQATVAAQTAEAQVAMAQAGVAQAQAQVEALEADASPADRQAAQAAVAQAEAQVAAAQAALAPLTIQAPFAGTVAALLVKAGTQVGPATPALVLADLSAWEVQTESLTELDVVRIAVGDQVTVAPDALEELALTGTVTRIDPQYIFSQGDVTYTAHIRLDETDPRLRWGMGVAIRFQ